MLKYIRNIYTRRQNTLYSSTIVVALTLILARLLGLLKLRILTSFYQKELLDLFFAAFRLPDFIFEVFIAGSIAACFIPIVSDILDDNEKNRTEAIIFSQSLSVIFLAGWLIFTAVMFFYSESIIRLLVPGFNTAQVIQVSKMSNTILFYQVPFLLLGNVGAALLQSSRQFLIPGLAPAFYNLGIILGIIVYKDAPGITGALYGVILGSILYFLLLMFGLAMLKFPIVFKLELKSKRIKTFFKLFWPRFFTSATTQIDATVDLALSTLRDMGSYTSFFLARNLQILPVSLFGIAISQSALPFFSSLYQQGKKKELMDLFLRLVLHIIFVMMPFVIFFTALRIPLVRLFFGGQMFEWEATVTTAKVLSVFAISLPFHTIYYVITRVYFAIQDTRTPFITGLIFTVLNTLLSILFITVYQLPIWYLALSFSISITCNSGILMYILLKRLDHYSFKALLIKLSTILFISLTTFAIVWTTKRLLDGLVYDTTRTLNLFLLTCTCVGIGSMSYLYLAWVFLPKQLADTLGLFTRLSIIKKTLTRYRKFFYPQKTMIIQDEHFEDKILN